MQSLRRAGTPSLVCLILLAAVLSPSPSTSADVEEAVADCEVPITPGETVTCEDGFWQETPSWGWGVAYHPSLHGAPYSIGVSGTVDLVWITDDGHWHFRASCKISTVGDAPGLLARCGELFNGPAGHWHPGWQTMVATATLDPLEEGSNDCTLDRLAGYDTTCALHASMGPS